MSPFNELDRQLRKSIDRWENEGGAPFPTEYARDFDLQREESEATQRRLGPRA